MFLLFKRANKVIEAMRLIFNIQFQQNKMRLQLMQIYLSELNK